MLLFLLSSAFGAFLGVYLKSAYPYILKVIRTFDFIVFGAMIFGAILAACYPGPDSLYPVNSWSRFVRLYLMPPLMLLWLALPLFSALTIAYLESRPLPLDCQDSSEVLRSFIFAFLISIPAYAFALLGLLFTFCTYGGRDACVL